MALSGSIKEFGLTEVFQLIFHQGKEGRLILKREGETITVLFKNGKIIRANEGAFDEAFGKNLLKAKILTEDQLAIARYRQESKKISFEATLVELGFVSAEEVRRLSRLFTEEVIFSLFSWISGEYRFEQGEVSYNPNLIQALDTQFLLMEAIRQIDEWPLLLKQIPSGKMIFEKTESVLPEVPSKDEASKTQEDSFESLEEAEKSENDSQAWLLEQINAHRTVQEMVAQARMGAFQVYQGLSVLLNEHKIKEVLQKEEPRKEPGLWQKGRLLRSALNTLVILVAGVLCLVSYPSIQAVSSRAERSFQEVKKLSSKNEGYFIRFALDLYYLKHKRYPESLRILVEEGFLGTKMNFSDRLRNWDYRLGSENSEAFFLENRG